MLHKGMVYVEKAPLRVICISFLYCQARQKGRENLQTKAGMVEQKQEPAWRGFFFLNLQCFAV